MTDHELDAWIHENVRGVTDKTYAVPEYTADLNDCAKAEEKIVNLGVDIGLLWVRNLLGVMYEHEPAGASYRPTWTMAWQLATATARQRCEAMHAIRDQIEKARAA